MWHWSKEPAHDQKSGNSTIDSLTQQCEEKKEVHYFYIKVQIIQKGEIWTEEAIHSYRQGFIFLQGSQLCFLSVCQVEPWTSHFSTQFLKGHILGWWHLFIIISWYFLFTNVYINPFTSKISMVLLLTVCLTILNIVLRIWYWITLKSPNSYFLCSHNMSVWYVGRNSVLVTHQQS